jgi:hypothetical protein
MSVEVEHDETLVSGTGVRRHHTISAASRPIRAAAIAEETIGDDEQLGEEWVGPLGAVGEKSSSLHRQASLPTSKHYYRNGCDFFC